MPTTVANDVVTVGRRKYEALRAKVARLEQENQTLRLADRDAWRAGFDFAEAVGDAARERDHLREQVQRLTMALLEAQAK